jgi:hypothetical protein
LDRMSLLFLFTPGLQPGVNARRVFENRLNGFRFQIGKYCHRAKAAV